MSSATKTLVDTASPSELVDWRGTPIEVGSTIVYPGRGSSALWMSEGTVVSVETRGRGLHRLRVQRTFEHGRAVRNPSRPVVLEVVKRVTVVPPR